MSFEDWKGTEFVPYLLPIIPAGSKINHAISKLSDDKLGKLPGKWIDKNGWAGFRHWQEHRATEENLDWWQRWYFDQPCATIGMRTGDFIFIDIDVTNPKVAEKIAAAFQWLCGPAPMRRRSNSSKCGLLYRLDTKNALSRIRKSRFVFNYLFEEHAVEILGDGEQFVCEGMHPSGVQHEWTEPVQTTELTPITAADIDRAMSMVREIVIEEGYEIKHATAADRGYDSANAALIGEGDVAPDLEQLGAVLDLIPTTLPEFAGYQEWFVALCAIKQACAGDKLFYHDHVVPWAAAVPANVEVIDESGTTYLETKWQSITSTEVGFAHLEHIAHNYGYTGDAQREFDELPPDPDQPDAPSGPPLQPDLQTKVAVLFVEKHAHQDRIVVAGRTRGAGEWYSFTPEAGVWQPHLTPLYDVRQVCEEIAAPISRLPGATNATRTRILHSEHTHAAVERMLRQDPALVIDRSQLNPSSVVVGVPGGYVDEHGKLRDPDPGMLLTMSMRHRPAPTEDCPRFLGRLRDTFFDGDRDKYECFRAWCGYMMTGTGNEQRFMFVLGDQGGEGKSTILTIIADVLCSYAGVVDYHAFMQKTENRFQLGGIAGKRYLLASEVDDEQTWADVKLKDMTGSVPITIEQKYVAPFETQPTWALTFAGNAMPSFRRFDPALWRRMITLQVFHQLTTAEVDPAFRRYCATEEGPGIARWLINAEQDYLRIGRLLIPASVQKTTDEFFKEQDRIGQWIEECIEFDSNAVTPMAELYDQWTAWCDTQNGAAYTYQKFGRILKTRKEFRHNGVRFDRSRINGRQAHCMLGAKIGHGGSEPFTTDQ